MQLEISYYGQSKTLCFRHAVLAALAGENIDADIEYNEGRKRCEVCDEEMDRDEKLIEFEIQKLQADQDSKSGRLTIRSLGEETVLAECPIHRIAYTNPDVYNCPLCESNDVIERCKLLLGDALIVKQHGSANENDIREVIGKLQNLQEYVKRNAKRH